MASSNGAQVATLQSIEAALKLVDSKKESLKRAYDDLQAHSSLLSSFSLSWSELDSYFSSLQSSLTSRFQVLQSRESSNPSLSSDSIVALQEPGVSDRNPTANGGDASPSIQLSESQSPSKEPSSSRTASIGNCAPRPELVVMCEKMDGRGLRNYFNDHPRERILIREELISLMRVSPDAGALVLDAMEGFFPSNPRSKGDKDMALFHLRKSCLDVLEVLIESKPVLSDQVRERAKMLAFKWKEKASLNGDSPLEALGFLNLIVAFDLGREFEAGSLLDYFVIAARFKQAADLCRAIGLGDKINDLVQKLIESGKRLLAVKLVFEFRLTEKFKPVPLLKEHLNELRKSSKSIFQEGKKNKAMHDAISKEVNAMKAVLKIIDEHNLNPVYPRQELEKEIEMLEKKQKAEKVAAPSPDIGPQQHQNKPSQARLHQSRKQQGKRKRPNGNSKRPLTSPMTGQATIPNSISGSTSAVHPFFQSHLPPTGLLSAGPYGVVGSSPVGPEGNKRPRAPAMTGLATVPGRIANSSVHSLQQPRLPTTGLLPALRPGGLVGSSPVASYAGASAGPYSTSGVVMGYRGDLAQATANTYTDPHAPTGYYSGYGRPPQYHPNYYRR